MLMRRIRQLTFSSLVFLLGATLSACDGAATDAVATGGASATTGGAGGASSASSAQGGTTSTGGTTAAVATTEATNGNFVLAWEDNFDTLDPSLWALQTFTWEGNQATFSRTNATVADGILTMSLTKAPTGAAKPYLGVEARSTKTLTYGKVSARMKFASKSGVISGLVLFYTPYPNCDWNEIDIEHLGKTPNSSQLNAMVYTGTYDASCTTSVSPTQDPLVTELGFDAEADFHVYDIEWTPTDVKYYADGALLRTWTKSISLLQRPMNILLTIWASNAVGWAGAIDDATIVPTSAQLDWIKVYDYK
jgi:beta-glucanase (GH16 family)